MLKLFRYLKPYLPLILASIGLLFIQANADLALPDYLSRIINIGIQQGGVESALPQVIRQNALKDILLLLPAEDRALVESVYSLVDNSHPDYAAYQQGYPGLKGEGLYVLGTVQPAERERLEKAIAPGLITAEFIRQLSADPQKAQALSQSFGFDLSQLPPGVDLFRMLKNLPEGQRTQLIAALQQRLGKLGENLTLQMGIAAVKTEYTALGVDTSRMQTSYILRTGGMMLLITLVSVAATILVGYLSARVAAGVARDLRQAVFVRVTDFSNAEIEKFSTASLITRSTNDITQLQMVTMILMRMVFYAPIIGVGGIIRAVDKAVSMWWIIALMVTVLIGIVISSFTITMPKFKSIQTLIDKLNRIVRENLEGMMVVRAFNRQEYEEQRFDQTNRDLTHITLFVSRVMVTLFPLMMFLMSGTSLLVIWVGARQVSLSQMQVGDMMAFMQYAMQIFFAFMMMSMMFIMLPRASVSGERIAEVLETDFSIKDPPHPKHFPEPFRGVVEFREVCFRYPGAEKDVLHGISFRALPGETTAFIGTTGSGKSTIVNLIPRFYDVSAGSITIDGVDIREVSQSELRSRIGYVPQRSNLFTGTIESNLRFGDGRASPEDLALAAEISQALAFIQARPEGFQAEISQGGTNVSGGERQRLAIARALVKKAPIYIFDDSFSALDFKTDAALRQALKKYVKDSTVFIVTQRVATIKNAEQIIVLDEGRIVGKGTHRELMATCEVYRDIALSQLSEEELA